MRRALALLIALVALTGAATSADAHAVRAAHSVEWSINELRADHGCGPVHAHAGLARSANRFARLLLADGKLDHDAGTPFVDRLEQAAPTAHLWGENLAVGSGESARPEAIVEAWMNSPEHRAIMLDCRFSQIGVGVATGRYGERRDGSVYTADFAA
ncbi:MAG TPA: CAP domain-containing protein [Gaiellales bacterium]|jgi:uncharacterized protein YkwD